MAALTLLSELVLRYCEAGETVDAEAHLMACIAGVISLRKLDFFAMEVPNGGAVAFAAHCSQLTALEELIFDISELPAEQIADVVRACTLLPVLRALELNDPGGFLDAAAAAALLALVPRFPPRWCVTVTGGGTGNEMLLAAMADAGGATLEVC